MISAGSTVWFPSSRISRHIPSSWFKSRFSHTYSVQADTGRETLGRNAHILSPSRHRERDTERPAEEMHTYSVQADTGRETQSALRKKEEEKERERGRGRGRGRSQTVERGLETLKFSLKPYSSKPMNFSATGKTKLSPGRLERVCTTPVFKMPLGC